MTRVLVAFAFVAALVGTAVADKAKLAVLGLEVAGSIDTESTSQGRLLTDMFRTRVGISQRYVLAANSLKDLLDEKVANGCDTEQPDCMAKIGSKMKAAMLLYGKIEKRPKDGKEGYQLSIKALDVDKKSVKEWSDWVPLSDFVDGGLDARIGRGFDTLVGKDKPDPVVTTVTGTAGPMVVAPKKSDGFPWKITAVVSTGLAMAAFGTFIYTGPIKTKGLEKDCRPINASVALDEEASYPADGVRSPSDCAKGPSFAKYSKISGIAAAALGGFALFAYYEGFIAKRNGESDKTVGRSTRKKKQFAVTPILSPDGAGATVRLDW